MPAQEILWLFIPLLFIVAFLYSSVGHGGASAYLALMVFFGISTLTMRSSALLLNIVVSAIAFFHYYRGGYFRWNLFLPFVILSVPAAFAGAHITPDAVIYKKILGLLLIFPILRLSGFFGKEHDTIIKVNRRGALVAGGVIGLLSGMTGIGGGILLSPLILLMRWGSLKESAAVSALFIFVNSVAGFAGAWSSGAVINSAVYYWLPVVVAGGLAGGYYGRQRADNKKLKLILSTVLVIAVVKLFNV